MIIDNIKLIDGSIENAVVESGMTLPTVDNVPGRIFYLSQVQGPNAIGLYVYSGSEWVLFSSSAYVDDRIADLIGTAPATLDSLAELATSLGDDPDFILTINAKVDAETTRATLAESANADNLTAEITRAGGVETTLQSNIDNEVTGRTASDANLQAQITAETSARSSDVSGLQTQIDNNSTTGDANVATKVSKSGDIMTGALTLSGNPSSSNHAVNKTYVDDINTVLAAADVTEQGARVTADNALGARIDAEIAARGVAIVGVQGDVTSETTRATSVEGTLNAKIDTEISDRAASDTVLQGSITDETNRAISVEDDLIADIVAVNALVSNEVSDRAAADVVLQNQIDANDAAILAEVSDRANSDGSLQSQIDAANAVNHLRGDIDDTMAGNLTLLLAPTLDGHASNKKYVDDTIDAVIAAAPGALDTLNELATALANDPNFATTITNQIAAEETARIAADGTIQSDLDGVKASFVERFTDSVTTDFTVPAGQQGQNAQSIVFADTSGGAITVTLPAAPVAGCTVTITDGDSSFGVNNLIIARNGKLIMGFADDMTVATTNASVTLAYSTSANGWRLVY